MQFQLISIPLQCTRSLRGEGRGGGSKKNKKQLSCAINYYGYFLNQHKSCYNGLPHRRQKKSSILSLKHKFEHTASCSSSSASAANSPFLIPSEFLLESSSERGNWYRVFRAFNRTCGNNRISMLINVKWKNVSMFCIYAFGQTWTNSDPGLK